MLFFFLKALTEEKYFLGYPCYQIPPLRTVAPLKTDFRRYLVDKKKAPEWSPHPSEALNIKLNISLSLSDILYP
jgi:hypothetical protein